LKYKIENFNEALNDYTEAIKINQNNSNYLFKRAEAKTKLKNYSDSLDDYTEAIKIDPSNIMYYLQKARANYKIGHYNEVIEDWNGILKLKSQIDEFIYLDTLTNRGILKSGIGLYSESIADFTEALQVESYITFNYRAKIYYKMGLYSEALEDVEKALTQYDNNTDSLKIKAFSLLLKNEISSAKSIFEQFLALEDWQCDKFTKPYAEVGNLFIDWLEGKESMIINQVFYDTYASCDLKDYPFPINEDKIETSSLLGQFLATVVENHWVTDTDKIQSAFEIVLPFLIKVSEELPTESTPLYWLSKLTFLKGDHTQSRHYLEKCQTISPQHELAKTLSQNFNK